MQSDRIMRDAPPNSGSGTLFVNTPAKAQRAPDANSQPFPTVCFQEPRINQPHHHRLTCGHDIQTRDIQRCGENCQLSKGGKVKISEDPFECPDPVCIKKRTADDKRKAVFYTSVRNRKIVRPRKCRLSHVYGIDEKADAQRHEEKTSDMFDGFGGFGMDSQRTNYRTREEMSRHRKRSRSPTLNDRRSKKEEKDPIDDAEIINQLAMHDKGYQIAMTFSGPGVRPKIHGRLMTRKDIEAEVGDRKVAAALDRLQVETPEGRAEKTKQIQKRKLQLDPSFGMPDKTFDGAPHATSDSAKRYLNAECDYCNNPIFNVRYKCMDCADYDLCQECWSSTLHGHTHTHHFQAVTKPYHRVKPDDLSLGSGEGNRERFVVAEEKTYCICKTTLIEFLVPCDHCGEAFHPKCHGVGSIEYQDSDTQRATRYGALRRDYDQWKAGKTFKCQTCAEKHTQASDTLEKGIRTIREKEEKAKQYYKPIQVVQKRIELNKATTEAETAAIQAKWAAIEAQQAEEEIDDDDGWSPYETVEPDDNFVPYEMGSMELRSRPLEGVYDLDEVEDADE